MPNKPYNAKIDHHSCKKICTQCRQFPICPETKKEIECSDCNRRFKGTYCYDNHKMSKSSGKSICEQLKKCHLCLKCYGGARDHVCDEFFCKNCQNHVSKGHLCYILPNTKKPSLKSILYIFYDLECRQESVIGYKDEEGAKMYPIKEHEPNLCVFQQKCDQCIENEDLYFCQICKLSTNILKGDEIIPKFLQHVLKVRKIFNKVIVIAHNGQAYDHQFILHYILKKKTQLSPELIMRGTKILAMYLSNVKFIDSINYFPMALSKLPKAFDLPSVLKKGYFPYLFNTKENEKYVGKLPALEFYSPDTMKTEERDIFLKWYSEHKNYIFDMEHEIVEYCKSDVRILTGACLRFRKLFLSQSNVEPFLEAITIASACNLLFRRNFLKPDTIGLIPKKGYRCVDNQSVQAIQWLIWEEKKRNINIKHAFKGREEVINGVKVDGFCKETNQIFEFHGCYVHGHPLCLKHQRDTPLFENATETLNQRYERTIAKTERLRKFNYEVIEMWSCEFQNILKKLNKKELNFLKNHELIQNAPLIPRDAFYGGRTGNSFNYYKCKEGEKIQYIDICSLYPWVCKTGKFPIGHPKIHVYGDANCSATKLQHMNGIVKCKVLPPEHLLHPVLPIKQNNKLMFSLCRSCSDEKNLNPICTHSNEERALIGTWVIDEVMKAVQKGYILLTVIEIWEYEVVEYNSETNSDGLFTSMMNKFLKIKQEASGWPSECSSEHEKLKYIDDFFAKENIQLEYSEICNNPGKRSLAKLILNSFWGKFGQNENQIQTIILNIPSTLFHLFTHPSTEVEHVFPINQENIVVNFEMKEEALDSLSTVNVCIAAFTTTLARLKLYSYLESLEERVLYYDTDSVIYVSSPEEYQPSTGTFIGDMTDELESYGIGSYITEFVSGGPKNYSFKVFSTNTNTEEYVCKVKGICMDHDSSQIVNFDSIKNAVLNNSPSLEDKNRIIVRSNNIKRTEGHQVITIPESKTYKVRAEKRRFLEDHSSLPYGYYKS